MCIYGSWKTITGRGRMLEMLFLWMVVPLILMAVFSVNSVDVDYNRVFEIPIDGMKLKGLLGVLSGGYGILLLLQGMELMLFTLGHARNNTKSNILKVIIWINITLFMAYIFIMGILGRRFVVKDVKASFNVMEAASFPGNAINRLDYLILSFLMIGVFATVSGYLFWGRSLLECSSIKEGSFWRIIITIVVLVAMVVFLCVPVIRRILLMYVFLADFAVSILLSLVVFMPDK